MSSAMYYYSSYYDKRKVVVLASPAAKTIRRAHQTLNQVVKSPSWVSASLKIPMIYLCKLVSYFTPKRPYSDEIPVYYINLETAIERRAHIHNHLKEIGFHNIYPVPAWTPDDVHQHVNQKVSSIKNMMHPNDREIGCIASHLHAMFLAVNDSTNTNPYAIIIEDDVRFPFAIDWQGMIEAAPKDFAILQLTTSHGEKMQKLWEEYTQQTETLLATHTKTTQWDTMSVKELQTLLKSDYLPQPQQKHQTGTSSSSSTSTTATSTSIPTTKQTRHMIESSLPIQLAKAQWIQRSSESALWSTQGYIIQKASLKELLSKMIHTIPPPPLPHNTATQYIPPYPKEYTTITLIPMPGYRCLHHPCLLPFRIVADIYLYTLFSPTYMSRIPLLNGELYDPSSIMAMSSIQQEKRNNMEIHQKEFVRVEQILEDIRCNGSRYAVRWTSSSSSSSIGSEMREVVIHPLHTHAPSNSDSSSNSDSNNNNKTAASAASASSSWWDISKLTSSSSHLLRRGSSRDTGLLLLQPEEGEQGQGQSEGKIQLFTDWQEKNGKRRKVLLPSYILYAYPIPSIPPPLINDTTSTASSVVMHS